MRPVHVGRLETVTDWRRQIGKVYREMRRGQIATEVGTRLTYVADVGARLAKMEQELRENQQLREEIARFNAGVNAGESLSQGIRLLPAADERRDSQSEAAESVHIGTAI